MFFFLPLESRPFFAPWPTLLYPLAFGQAREPPNLLHSGDSPLPQRVFCPCPGALPFLGGYLVNLARISNAYSLFFLGPHQGFGPPLGSRSKPGPQAPRPCKGLRSFTTKDQGLL